MPLLRVRKVADPDAPHIVVNHPQTGRAMVVNPVTGVEEARPLKGVELVDDEAPDQITVGTTFINRAVSEGWAELRNTRVVFRPSGPAGDKWNASYAPHSFIQADQVIFHFLSGDVTYNVTHQPDKYVAGQMEYKGDTIDTYPDFSLDDEPVTDEHYNAGKTRVDWFYGLELVREGRDQANGV